MVDSPPAPLVMHGSGSYRSTMITDGELATITQEVQPLTAEHPIVTAYETLHRMLQLTEVSGEGLAELARHAGESLDVVLADDQLWSVLAEFENRWQYDDTLYVNQLLERYE